KITVNDSKTVIAAGAQDTYSISVINLGPGFVDGASITDAFPTIFTNVSYTATQLGGASGFSATGAANINDTVVMPSGSNITYKSLGTSRASPTSALSNTARVLSPTEVIHSNTANNTATDTDTLSPRRRSSFQDANEMSAVKASICF